MLYIHKKVTRFCQKYGSIHKNPCRIHKNLERFHLKNNSIHTGASGLNASRRRLETSAHNVANVNTDGFKKQRTLNRETPGGVQSVTDRPDDSRINGPGSRAVRPGIGNQGFDDRNEALENWPGGNENRPEGFGNRIKDTVELSGANPAQPVESSNVNPAEEAVNQIDTLAAAKANANSIKTGDDMLGTVLDIKK